LKKMTDFLGKASIEDVFTAMRETLITLRSNQDAYWFQWKDNLNAIELKEIQKILEEINGSKVYSKWVTGLSASLEKLTKLKEFNDYFTEFVKEMQEREKSLQERAKKLISSEQIKKSFTEVKSLYESVDDILSAAVSADAAGRVVS
jgi:hypothetical protein